MDERLVTQNLYDTTKIMTKEIGRAGGRVFVQCGTLYGIPTNRVLHQGLVGLQNYHYKTSGTYSVKHARERTMQDKI